MKNSICRVLTMIVILGGMCVAAPEPAIVQGPSEWTVDVRFEHPQQIMLRLSANAKPKRFWYMIVTVNNKTGRDVDFYPKCELMTDTFQVIPQGRRTPAVVFEQIKRRHQGKYPFIESLQQVGNKILQGRDNTRDIAIIWPDFDGKAKNVKIFISGLSNETAVVEHPTAKDKNGRPVKVYLRKTLELSYSVGGDAQFRSEAKLLYKDKKWVMR